MSWWCCGEWGGSQREREERLYAEERAAAAHIDWMRWCRGPWGKGDERE